MHAVLWGCNELSARAQFLTLQSSIYVVDFRSTSSSSDTVNWHSQSFNMFLFVLCTISTAYRSQCSRSGDTHPAHSRGLELAQLSCRSAEVRTLHKFSITIPVADKRKHHIALRRRCCVRLSAIRTAVPWLKSLLQFIIIQWIGGNSASCGWDVRRSGLDAMVLHRIVCVGFCVCIVWTWTLRAHWKDDAPTKIE